MSSRQEKQGRTASDRLPSTLDKQASTASERLVRTTDVMTAINHFYVRDTLAGSDCELGQAQSSNAGDVDLAAILEAIVAMDAPMRALLNRRRR